MGSFSLMHWVVVLAIVLIIFGAGKLPRMMGDFAKGIKAFKKGMAEDEPPAADPPPPQVPPPAATPTTPPAAAAADPKKEKEKATADADR
jgi:sec-independent protein translocase protein TatA